MQWNFKKSDKAFYYSPFGGILPCEIIRTGRRKIYIRIDGYDTSIWVTPGKVLLPSSDRANQNLQ